MRSIDEFLDDFYVGEVDRSIAWMLRKAGRKELGFQAARQALKKACMRIFLVGTVAKVESIDLWERD